MNVYEAKTQLSKLLAGVENGDDELREWSLARGVRSPVCELAV
ncbi:hypothetical protein BH20ACT4_BH20ACT4_03180 [soil metagenome]